MKRLKLDWIFGVIIFACIAASMAGSEGVIPFQIHKSFQRVCTSYWSQQDILAQTNPEDVGQSCSCITNAMLENKASDDEFSVLIQWLSTTHNYDREKYYTIAKYDGKSVFIKSLDKCTGDVETASSQ